MTIYDERKQLADALDVIIESVLEQIPVKKAPYKQYDPASMLSKEERNEARGLIFFLNEPGNANRAKTLIALATALRQPTKRQVDREKRIKEWNETGAIEFANRMRKTVRTNGVLLRRPRRSKVGAANEIVGAFVVCHKARRTPNQVVTITVYGKGAAAFMVNLLTGERIIYHRLPRATDREAVIGVIGKLD